MNRHEGVSCDACLKGNFRGRRYKCLLCFDYDLCAQCYEQGATTTRHTTDHPMQCILTRADYELYYGGEVITMDQPQSYTCPYCNTMGYTDIALQEHVSSEHSDASFEVVCPVCASMIGGDPNMVTDDLAAHLTVEHRAGSAAASNSGPRDLISFLDEPNASAGTSVISRHGVRRTPHGTRGVGVGGPRARRNNMHFSSSGGLASLSPSARDTVDPIAELLSQLSGVRRSAGNNASVAGNHATNNPTQLQQLQMQLQLERQQVARQQLERLPRRQAASVTSANSADRSNAGSITSSAVSVSVSGSSAALAPPPGIVPSTNSKPISDQNAHAPSVNFSNQFLLATTIDEPLSEEAQEKLERLRANRSQFVQEILLASVAEIQGRPPRSKVKESNSSTDKTEKENLVKDKSVTTSQNQSRCNKTKGPRGRGRPSSSGEPVTSINTDEGAKGCDRRTGENVNRSKNMQATKGPSPRCNGQA